MILSLSSDGKFPNWERFYMLDETGLEISVNEVKIRHNFVSDVLKNDVNFFLFMLLLLEPSEVTIKEHRKVEGINVRGETIGRE